MYENEIYSNADTQRYATYQTQGGIGPEGGNGGGSEEKVRGAGKRGVCGRFSSARGWG